MSKTELFDHILSIVAEETELPAVRILSRKRDAETVDARYLLVYFLSDTGFTPSYIAERIGFTERAVTYIQTNFEERRSVQKILIINYENIRRKLRNNSFCA